MTKKLDQIADQAYGAAVRNLNGLVQENRAPLKDFTQNGLQQFQGLAVDIAAWSWNSSYTVNTLDHDPSRLIYGDRREDTVRNEFLPPTALLAMRFCRHENAHSRCSPLFSCSPAASAISCRSRNRRQRSIA